MLILKAESLSIQRQQRCWRKPSTGAVKDAYDFAIQASARSGFLQDHALANELAGHHFLWEENESFLSRTYIKRAYEIYNDWGASAKSAELKNRFSELFGSEFFPTSLDASDGHRARERYSEDTLAAHRSMSIALRTSKKDDASTNILSRMSERRYPGTARHITST